MAPLRSAVAIDNLDGNPDPLMAELKKNIEAYQRKPELGIAPASYVAGQLARKRSAHWLAVPAHTLCALLGAHIRPEHVGTSPRALFACTVNDSG